MKLRLITPLLLVTLLLEACSVPNNTEVPQKTITETPQKIITKVPPTITEVPQKITEVLPGMYMSNDPASFPFPTSGYTVYIVGESHGSRETKLIFQAFLDGLYRKQGLRDVILEEDQAYEPEANAYVLGQTDVLSAELCLRADILKRIREFNAARSADKKVNVHLVDVDSPLRTIHKHLTDLQARIGAKAEAIQIPTLSEFETWDSTPTYDLIEKLKKVSTGQPDILNELETVRLSVEWYYLGNRLETGWPTGSPSKSAPIREDIITKNIQYVLAQLNGKPVMAFFGLAHGMKTMDVPYPPAKDFKTWAQRIKEENINVYSVAIFGETGNSYWHGRAFSEDSGYVGQLTSGDGSRTVSLFDTHPDLKIIYIDYRVKENSTLKLPSDFGDLPASQMYDGLILFKEFTAMENVCPE